MTWDPTITAGNLIETTVIVAAAVGAYVRIRERLIGIEAKLENQLDPLWNEFVERRTGHERRQFTRRSFTQDTGE